MLKERLLIFLVSSFSKGNWKIELQRYIMLLVLFGKVLEEEMSIVKYYLLYIWK